ncbi:Metallo-dependent phosphatase-like protein [Fennellomyces sp. T-0311]|nr:Metallo-dependent phosphatase-like protein [Fennellomyces sp. T-0311]
MKEKAKALKKDLFIVDTGDTHDGNGLSDSTSPDGQITQPMLAHIPYDLLAIGNHELYINEVIEDVYHNFMPRWNGRYLASNVYFKDLTSGKTVPFGDKYTYFEGEFGTRVLAFGFLYNFDHNGSKSVIRTAAEEVKESWFINALTAHKPDIFVLIGHTGVRSEAFDVVRAAIREKYPYAPIGVLGGHLHIRDFAVYDGWSAGIASGRFMETVGFFSIKGIHQKTRLIEQDANGILPKNLTFFRRYLDQNRASYIYHAVNGNTTQFDTPMGQEITKNITNWRHKLGLMAPLGCPKQNYYMTRVPVNDTASIYKLTMEEVLPKIVIDKARVAQRYFLFDTGTIRFDIYEGPFTMDTVKQVTPFPDGFDYIQDVPRDAAVKIAQVLIESADDDEYGMPSLEPENCEDRDSQSYHKHRKMTPGYITQDDLGRDGDDTKHLAIPDHPTPHFIASKLPETPTVDLIFTHYSGPQVQNVTQQVTGKQYRVEEAYGGSDIRSDTIWAEYAKKYWAKGCKQK